MIKNIVVVILLLIYLPIHGQQFILQEHDKQLHFGAGMITSALGYTWSYNKHQDKKRAMITGICTSFAAGVAKELFDGGIMGGYVDHRDILATTMGGLTMSVTIPLFQPKKKRYRQLDKWKGGYKN
jgi:putative lipoprotein